MASATQQLFKKIVLHNKLLAEPELDKLLGEVPDPEKAIQRLIDRGVIPAKTAAQLQALYRKQVDSLMADLAYTSAITSDHPLATPAATAVPAAKAPSGAAALPAVSKPASRTAPQPPAAVPPPRTTPTVASPPAAKIQVDHLRGLRGAPLLRGLLQIARQSGGSDLHVTCGVKPVLRIAGELRDLPWQPLTPEECEQALVAILKDDQRQQFLETSDLDFCYDGGPELGRFRANVLREHRGTAGVFRPIPDRIPSFEELNLPETVERFTDYRVGIVLVTGPKGCGKTTTLAAMVDLINSTRGDHIITLEDPIEFVHPCKRGHVNQREVGTHTLSFSNALRAALREAPDVILVGEMRDLETTSLAITAAETGHLVLATLHTPDALRTIGRVLDVFPAKEQGQIRAMLSESLRGIVSQQLIPRADGSGMVLALEILVNTPAIGHLIREERVFQIPGLMQTGRRLGMLLMDESLVALVRQGRIREEEALSLAHERALVEKELARAPAGQGGGPE